MNYKNNIAHDGGRYHVRKKLNGKIIKRAFPTKRSAMMFLEYIVLDAAGVLLDGPPLTLSEAIDEYIAECERIGRSANTLHYYRAKRMALDAEFGNRLIGKILQRHIDAFIDQRRTEVCNGTVNKEVAFLKTIYHHCDVRPLWRAKPLSHRVKRKRVHPPSDVAGLWHTLTSPARCAVGLCLLTGMRAEEVWRADASWVHGDEIDTEIEKSGGETNRTWLVKTLRDILPKRGPLVTVAQGVIRHEIKRNSKMLKIDPPFGGPGVFRHHCATYATDLGIPRDHVKLVLGHQFGDVTDRYLHSQEIEKKRQVLEAVERHVFDGFLLGTPDATKSGENVPFDHIGHATEDTATN
jgi:integrase